MNAVPALGPEEATTSEQRALRAVVRDFLADTSSSAELRRLIETADGFDRTTWLRLATELELPGIAIAEEHGGSGGSAADLAIVLEEMGAALFPAPFFAATALAAQLLGASGDVAAMTDLLPGIASGTTIATACFDGVLGAWGSGAVPLRAAGTTVSGELRSVVAGPVADLFVVPAVSAAGISLFAVSADAPGVTRTAMTSLDLTRSLARVRFDGAPARLIGSEGDAAAGLARASDLAVVALAAEQAGGAQRCLDMAVGYAKTRVQFGRAIGSFQAVKHLCADMLVLVESARSAAQHAARVAAGGDHAGLARAAAIAGAYCSDAFMHVATDALHVHGGIGFTYEHDAHLYVRRAKASQLMLGSPAYHRQRLAALI